MKYIKIELPKGKGGLEYPSGYNQLENFITDHLYVDEKETEKTYLCLSIKDGVDWRVILGNHDRIAELTKEEMVTFCEPYEQKREVITDEARVRRLTIKAQLGQQLTEEELKSLDPEDETPGFGLSKRFIDRI
jgi:hypothetical protein